MNRWISNIVLGFFTLILVTAYGVAKQPSVVPTSPTVWLKSLSGETSNVQGSAKVEGDKMVTKRLVLPNGTEVSVELATTTEARTQGLSGREGLSKGAGMLFVFDEDASQPMWMKDMNFALDMLWLDKEGKVVHVEENVPAPVEGQISLPTYASPTPARYVLEVTQGVVGASELKVGDKLELLS